MSILLVVWLGLALALVAFFIYLVRIEASAQKPPNARESRGGKRQ